MKEVKLAEGYVVIVPETVRVNHELEKDDVVEMKIGPDELQAKFTNKLMSGGRVYVPARIRYRLGMEIGDEICIEVQ